VSNQFRNVWFYVIASTQLSFRLVRNHSLRFLISPYHNGTGASRKDAGQASMTDMNN